MNEEKAYTSNDLLRMVQATYLLSSIYTEVISSQKGVTLGQELSTGVSFGFICHQGVVLNALEKLLAQKAFHHVPLAILTRPSFTILVDVLYLEFVEPEKREEKAQRYMDYFYIDKDKLRRNMKNYTPELYKLHDDGLHEVYKTKAKEFKKKYFYIDERGKKCEPYLGDWSGYNIRTKATLVGKIDTEKQFLIEEWYVFWYSFLSSIEHASISGIEESINKTETGFVINKIDIDKSVRVLMTTNGCMFETLKSFLRKVGQENNKIVTYNNLINEM